MRATVLFTVLLAAARAFPVSDNLTSLVFQSSETFITNTFNVLFMELDIHKNDGSILISGGDSLITVTDDQRVSVVVSGFRGIPGFAQINATYVALADYYNQCLKTVNRNDDSVKVLAGQRGSRGDSDGIAGQFDSPWGVGLDVRHPGHLLVTDVYNHALRSVNINTGVVSTVIRSGFNAPRGMTWIENRLMVVNDHYISEVVWSGDDTVTNTILAASTSSGDVDGSFSLSMFMEPKNIHPISADLYLVADRGNHKLRLLDISMRLVLPVCTNNHRLCKNSTTIDNPFSVLKTPDAVYVGQQGKITKLTGGLTVHTINSPCQEKNTTIRIRDETLPAIIDVGDGTLVRLALGTHYLYKDNCTIRVNVEAAIHVFGSTFAPACKDRNISITLSYGEARTDIEVFAGKWLNLAAGIHNYTDVTNGNCTTSIHVGESGESDDNSAGPPFDIVPIAVLSGLLLASVIFTTILVILFIKGKQGVHDLTNDQVVIQSGNALELEESADNGDVQQSTALNFHSSGNFEGCGNAGLDVSKAATEDSRSSSISHGYECIDLESPQVAVADSRSAEIFEGDTYAMQDVAQSISVDSCISRISGCDNYIINPDIVETYSYARP